MKPGGARGRFARVAGSLASAWKPGPTGRRWAPWAWTLVVNTLIAAILAVAVPKGGGFARYLLISQAIGLTIHALFWTIGHRLRFDMFEVSLPVRLVYVASVALAGSWLGYAAAWALILGDWPSLVEHMTRASRWLIAMPIAWAFATIALLALLSRVRGRQLAVERERGARTAAEREAIAARLQLLSAQIEPHFLYNTLAGIAAQIPAEADSARRLVEALTGYLRASSRNMARPLVSLSDELDSVRGYLEVMQLRLGARLRVRYRVSETALALKLPPAALLTLVENAIKHGIEPSRAGGEIVVSSSRSAAGWILEVADSGAGFGNATALTAGGTGLANLAERLRLALGAEARLTLEQREAGGAVARMLLPGSADEPDRVEREDRDDRDASGHGADRRRRAGARDDARTDVAGGLAAARDRRDRPRR